MLLGEYNGSIYIGRGSQLTNLKNAMQGKGRFHKKMWLGIFWGKCLKKFVKDVKYTQKKKFSQYLCFLIKSTILHISLSFFYMSFIIVT